MTAIAYITIHNALIKPNTCHFVRDHIHICKYTMNCIFVILDSIARQNRQKSEWPQKPLQTGHNPTRYPLESHETVSALRFDDSAGEGSSDC